jgi:hypothetical protein
MFSPIQRKARVWVGFLLFGTAALFANTARAMEALPKCCVWRVTNAKAPFYLVGSVHALGRDDYPLPSPYELASKDAKRLLLEFNPNRATEFEKNLPRPESIRPGKISARGLTPSFWPGCERMFHLSRWIMIG